MTRRRRFQAKRRRYLAQWVKRARAEGYRDFTAADLRALLDMFGGGGGRKSNYGVKAMLSAVGEEWFRFERDHADD